MARSAEVFGVAVVAFGAVLCGAGFAATDAPSRWLLASMGGEPVAMTAPLRFAVGLMGAVTLGWGCAMLAAFRAAAMLGERAAPVWRGLAAGMVGWFAIDSALSVATGFALNAASNAVFLLAFLLPLARTGVLRGSAARAGHA